MAHDDERIEDVATREYSRLGRFIRRRVPDPRDAEDILQDVYADLVTATRLLMPIDHLTGWLFRVARNRIADAYRAARRTPQDGDEALADLLPDPGDGPEAQRRRAALLAEIEAALAELPREQREVFVGHELEGRSFAEMSASTGVGVNTLLSRKRYAILHLRQRLRAVHDAWTEE